MASEKLAQPARDRIGKFIAQVRHFPSRPQNRERERKRLDRHPRLKKNGSRL